MKKSFALVFTGLLALSLTGCHNELNFETVIEGPTHSVVFTADKIIDTKTGIASEDDSGVSYKWIDGDIARMRITESYEYEAVNPETSEIEKKTSTKAGTITSMNITNDGKKATFNVTFAGNAPDAEVTYLASYAGSHSGNGNPLIPAAQSPLQASFDPAADVLVSDPIVRDARDTENDEFTFNMTRKVSVNKMTLKGLEEGEVISSVTFSSDKNHSAYYQLATGNYSSNGKTLTFSFTTNNTVPASGEFPVYFTTAPVDDATFTVTVTTDKNTYEKTAAKTISFACGTVRRFGVDLEGCATPISAGTVYTLVENQGDLYPGATYIIVANSEGSFYALGAQSTNNRSAVSVTEDSGVITIDNAVAAKPVVLESVSGGYLFKDAESNQYLYASSTSKNYMHSTDDETEPNAVWTISISEGVAHIVNVGNTDRGTMRFNPNNGSPLFAAYASTSVVGTGDLALYVDLDTCVPTLATPNVLAEVQNTNEIYVTWDEVANADSYLVTLSCTGQANQNIATQDEEATFTSLADGTYTVTVKAISNDHTSYLDSRLATVENLLIGTPKGSVSNPYTAGEILTNYPDGSGDDFYYVSGTISNIQEVSTAHGNATYTITDGVNSILVYRGKYLNNANFASESQIAVNDEVIVYGQIGVYNSTPQLAQGNYLYSINGKSKTLTAGSLSTTKDDENKTVTVIWGSATGTDSDISYVVNCGTQSYNANAAGSHTFTMPDYGEYAVTVVASASDAISAEVNTTVTLTDPNASGGTLTLDFESTASSYTDWTITNIVTQQTNSNVNGHTGSYYGDTDGKTTGSIVTKNTIASPGTLTFYVSKESTNTNAGSVWKISVSSNGSSWTQVGDDQAAASGITRGTWTEVSRDLSSYSNVYVKIEYSGTTAVRCIDDISLTYN